MNPGIERALGRWLRAVRAGDHHLAWNDPRLRDAPAAIALGSAAFVDGGAMPPSCAGVGVGDNRSPPLAWSGLPPAATAWALIMQDPDAPLPRPVTHLLAIGNVADGAALREGALSPPVSMASPSTSIQLGRGFRSQLDYAGPRPVRGHGMHRYVFQLFALRERPAFAATPNLRELLDAIAGRVVARGRLTGIYERN